MTCNKGEGKILIEGDIPRKSVSWRANFPKISSPGGRRLWRNGFPGTPVSHGENTYHLDSRKTCWGPSRTTNSCVIRKICGGANIIIGFHEINKQRANKFTRGKLAYSAAHFLVKQFKLNCPRTCIS